MFKKICLGLLIVSIPSAIFASEYCERFSLEQQGDPYNPDPGYGFSLKDSETKLNWLYDNKIKEKSWAGALDSVHMYNENGGFEGHVDWRLPNIKELFSIMRSYCKGNYYYPDSDGYIDYNDDIFDLGGGYLQFWSSTPEPTSYYGGAYEMSPIGVTVSESGQHYVDYNDVYGSFGDMKGLLPDYSHANSLNDILMVRDYE